MITWVSAARMAGSILAPVTGSLVTFGFAENA